VVRSREGNKKQGERRKREKVAEGRGKGRGLPWLRKGGHIHNTTSKNGRLLARPSAQNEGRHHLARKEGLPRVAEGESRARQEGAWFKSKREWEGKAKGF
jgi:hypothetical protein